MSFSFLICATPNRDAYHLFLNGRPIGIMGHGGPDQSARFTPHQFIGADGTKKSVRVVDFAQPNPFDSSAHMKGILTAIINAIEIESGHEKPPEDAYAQSRRLTEEALAALKGGDAELAKKLLDQALQPQT